PSTPSPSFPTSSPSSSPHGRPTSCPPSPTFGIASTTVKHGAPQNSPSIFPMFSSQSSPPLPPRSSPTSCQKVRGNRVLCPASFSSTPEKPLKPISSMNFNSRASFTLISKTTSNTST